MLTQVADDVLIHPSSVIRSNTVIVRGEDGVLLVDPGIRDEELADLAAELHDADQPVEVGFSTHPHWDHLLWHAGFGAAPRYGTAACVAAACARLSSPGWESVVSGMIPPDVLDEVHLDDLFGQIVTLPPPATRIPWHGPEVRVIEHQAHAPGHAALLIERSAVLVAGDMLSDVLIPVLNPMADDPIADYLHALALLERVTGSVELVIPGHGGVGRGDEVQRRIDQDRAYLLALSAGQDPRDPRLGSSAEPGWEWVSDIHTRQRDRLGR